MLHKVLYIVLELSDVVYVNDIFLVVKDFLKIEKSALVEFELRQNNFAYY